MTPEILYLLIILLVTVIFFIIEIFRVDVIAIMCMLSLVWIGILTPREAFSGISSSAVISIIGVMVIGYGVEKSGLMRKLSAPIIKIAGKSENRLIALVSLAVAGISSFLQNIGAAALFLPALRRIARDSKIHSSRLLMPMGFAAILGGTLTMVGSGPLILLNDLLTQAELKTFHLFSSTPIGLTLLAVGIIYFVLLGKRMLPKHSEGEKSKEDRQQKLIDTFDLHTTVYLSRIPEKCRLIGKTREEVELWKKYRLNLLALSEEKEVRYAPWRMTRFSACQELALFGDKEDVAHFFEDYNLQACNQPRHFQRIMNPESAGFAELIILPGAGIIGKTFRQIAFRKRFDVEPVLFIRGNTEWRGNFADIPLMPGDVIIVYGLWEKIEPFKKNEDFIIPTPVEKVPARGGKGVWAGLCLAGVILGVVIGIKLPVVLLTGAMAMVLLKVVSIDEAYQAVDWRTVFLLAGLIPLGIAMEKTGAALLISNQMMTLLENSPMIVILLAVGLLSTLFTLFMSNVAATVLLVPLVINMAQAAGIDPAAAAMLVAICASNSFILPTHQVNAFLMSPGGYHTKDYIKTGGAMTFIFLIVSVLFIYLFFL
jgi:di/tricarboxylate transporter